MSYLKWLGSLRVIGSVTVWQSAYNFLRLPCCYLVLFPRCIELFVEGRKFVLLHVYCIWRPRLGWLHWIIRKIFGTRKPEFMGLFVWHSFVMACSAVLIELWLVTDRQTDRQMNGHRDIAYRPTVLTYRRAVKIRHEMARFNYLRML